MNRDASAGARVSGRDVGRSVARGVLTLAVVGASVLGLAACSSPAVQQATSMGSAVASAVAGRLQGIDGSAIEQGMAAVAGGIDGALSVALGSAHVTSDGTTPDGFPATAVPLVDGTVMGGGAGPNRSGWVVQVRAASIDDFASAGALLTGAGYTASNVHTASASAIGIYRDADYQVILTFASPASGVVATYIVTPR